MECLGIYIVGNRSNKLEDYIVYGINELKRFCKKTIVVLPSTCKWADEIKVEIIKCDGNYYQMLLEGIKKEYKVLDERTEILVVTDRVYGPFHDYEDIIKTTENKTLRPLLYQPPCEKQEGYYDTSVMLMSSDIVKKTMNMSIEELFVNEEVKVVPIIDTSEYHNTCKEYNVKLFPNYSYELLKKKNCSFVPNDLFADTSELDKGFRENIRRTYDYIRNNTKYDCNFIWDYTLKQFNIADIKESMHLNYVLPFDLEYSHKINNKKIAVIAHLYYDDLYEDCINYLLAVPNYMDLYITVSSENNRKKLSALLLKERINNFTILVSGARGRDAGALLVACNDYLSGYDYLCFLHDKKTTGGNGYQTLGKSFMYHVWENMIKSTEYIENIIALFENNERLGLLAPPNPAMGGYLTELVGQEWTCCYEETVKLADMLGINVPMNKDKQPFALATAFWCRKKALDKLFDFKWSYDMFPEEPLRLDGMINHAIERILIYAAQDKGYYSALVENTEYASLYQNNIYSVLARLMGDLKEALIFESPLKIKMFMEKMIDIYLFCQGDESIYIYGAGANAKKMVTLLNKWQINFSGFIVTDINKNPKRMEDHNIYGFDEVCKKEKIKIIIALGSVYAQEVIPIVKKSGKQWICTWYE